MDKTPWIHVELPGHGTFWVEDAVLRGEDSGPLAPEDHVVDGELNLLTMFGSDTYAHCFPGERGIMRYHRTIATLADLKPIDRISVTEATGVPDARSHLPAPPAAVSLPSPGL